MAEQREERIYRMPGMIMAIDYDDDDWDCEGEELPECMKCHDTGKVIAMDGESEYLGKEYVPCDCREGLKWIGVI